MARLMELFFDRKAHEWREEQDRILRTIEEHHEANQSYLDEGIRILELANRAPALFQRQEPRKKRRLLNFILSNCTWKNGELEVAYRQPFDIIVEMNKEHEKKKAAYLPKSNLGSCRKRTNIVAKFTSKTIGLQEYPKKEESEEDGMGLTLLCKYREDTGMSKFKPGQSVILAGGPKEG